jgi:hypothetical protein
MSVKTLGLQSTYDVLLDVKPARTVSTASNFSSMISSVTSLLHSYLLNNRTAANYSLYPPQEIWGEGSSSLSPNGNATLGSNLPDHQANSSKMAVHANLRATSLGSPSFLKANSSFWLERVLMIERAVQLPCAASESDIPSIKGLSNNITLGNQRTVVMLPPAELMQVWKVQDLAADYLQVQKGRWQESAVEWIKRLPARELRAAVGHNPWYGSFASHVGDGSHHSAAKALSFYHGTGYDEPVPGIVVLRNGYFTAGTQAVHDCSILWFGGCWKINALVASNVKANHRQCEPSNNSSKLPRYKTVVTVSNSKSKFFYHFMTETISRLYLVADLLYDNPDIKISGLVGKRFRLFTAQAMEFLGLAGQDRMVITGCAEYLLIPEAARCTGLDMPMVNIVRAFIVRRLRALNLGVSKPPLGARGDVPSLSDVSSRPGWHKPYIILVKRRGSREVKNHEDVLGALQQRFNSTYEVRVHEGKTSLQEQLAFFHSAEAVVAPHGAGLSLIMAMRRGSGVVEFVPVAGTNLCYLYISFKVSMVFCCGFWWLCS